MSAAVPSPDSASAPEHGGRGSVREGLWAGLGFAAGDWWAAGPARTPWELALWIFASGLLAGVVAGLVARLVGRRGWATGLVLAGTAGVHGLSLASKELGPAVSSAGRGLTAAALLVGALLGGVLLARRLSRPRPGEVAAALAALLSVSGASLLFWALPDGPLWMAVSGLLPLAVVLAAGAGRVPARALALAAIVLLAIPVAFFEDEPPRSEVPAASTGELPADAPSVLLVVLDTLRADALEGEAGARDAPNLMRLADEGIRFEQAISSASWTLPGMSSILSGLYPSQHGATSPLNRLAPDVETLAESFQRAGWETVAFTGGGFVSPSYGLDQGFEHFDHHAEERFRPYRIHTPLAWRVAKNRYLPLRPLLRRVHEFGGLREVQARVRAWLDVREPGRPFLCLVHTYQVHDYYIYHPGPDDPLRREAAPETLASPLAQRLTVHPSELERASQAELDWFYALYRARLAWVDATVAELVEEVGAAAGPGGLVTAITADHGEGFDAARGRVHHGLRLHDDLLRVPWILHAPERLPPLSISAQVRSVDLMPTLLDLVGLALPPGLAGTSLLPCMRAGSWPADAFSEELGQGVTLRALRRYPFKLIAGSQPEERYQLARDPAEAQLLPRVPDEVRRSFEAFPERFPPRAAMEATVDEATLEHLRALGYVE